VRRHLLRSLLSGLLCGLLAACATTPPPPSAHAGDSLTGRLALRVEAHNGAAARSFAAPFELRGQAEAGQFSLFTPLGTTAARADWQAGQAVLTDEQGRQTRYSSLDGLAADMLGEALPMAALLDWLRGQPWTGAPHETNGTGFAQLGWQIDTRARDEGRIEARRSAPPMVTVRVRLETAR
jgi:outer membrane lipoprotein LolB